MKIIKGLLLVWLGVEIYISYSVIVNDFSFAALQTLELSIELALCAALFSLLVYLVDAVLWLALACFALIGIFGPAGVVIYVILRAGPVMESEPLIVSAD
ncbi:MAG: hypothetical protein JKX92_02725 [Porticoccaceae bacterium]|nr:hypothetical protein [Porticoccaceae bacterium]